MSNYPLSNIPSVTMSKYFKSEKMKAPAISLMKALQNKLSTFTIINYLLQIFEMWDAN